MQKGISYYFAEINKSTLKMVQEFNKELMKNKGKKIKLIKLPSVEDLTELITKSIMATINTTKKLTINSTAEKKDTEIDPEPIDWSGENFKKVNAIKHTAEYNGTVSELRSKPIEFKESNIEIKIAPKPFDKGSIRYAYAALINNGTSEAPDYAKAVVKQSIYKGPEYNSLKYFLI